MNWKEVRLKGGSKGLQAGRRHTAMQPSVVIETKVEAKEAYLKLSDCQSKSSEQGDAAQGCRQDGDVACSAIASFMPRCDVVYGECSRYASQNRTGRCQAVT